jgi:hypothetical protein
LIKWISFSPPISKVTHKLRSGAKNHYRGNRNKNAQTGQDKNKQLSVAFVSSEAQGGKKKAVQCGKPGNAMIHEFVFVPDHLSYGRLVVGLC